MVIAFSMAELCPKCKFQSLCVRHCIAQDMLECVLDMAASANFSFRMLHCRHNLLSTVEKENGLTLLALNNNRAVD